MKTFKPVMAQTQTLKQAFWVLSLYTLFFLAIIYVGILNGISPKMLIRDPAALVEGPFYIGLFSNIGVLFWTATVAVCFLTASFLSKAESGSPIRPFLFYGGLLTLFLLLDDFFLLHEDVLPHYLGLNGNIFTLLVYGLSILSLLFFFRNVILSTDFLLLAFALGLLGLSMTLDNMTSIFPALNFSGVYILEDLCKFLGILAWFVYFSRLAMFVLIQRNQVPATGQNQIEELATAK